MIRAFMLGAWEFRRAFTTAVPHHLLLAYDAGREFAHCVTLRHFED